MSERPHFFAFCPADFLADPAVSAMSATGCGVYIRLICLSWNGSDPGFIPSDDQTLARWGHVSLKTWERVKVEVLAAFKTDPDGRRYQKRLRQEWLKSTEAMSRKVKAGRAGADRRWQPHASANGTEMADAWQTHRSANGKTMRFDGNPEPEPEPDKEPRTRTRMVGASTKHGERKRSPKALQNITVEELRDTARVMRRIDALADDGVIENTEGDILNALGAAERALEVAHNPSAMFVQIVRERNWMLISAEQSDRARRRLAAFQRGSSGPPSAVLSGLAATFGAGVPQLTEGGDEWPNRAN